MLNRLPLAVCRLPFAAAHSERPTANDPLQSVPNSCNLHALMVCSAYYFGYPI
jgi:hypothetical protein